MRQQATTRNRRRPTLENPATVGDVAVLVSGGFTHKIVLTAAPGTTAWVTSGVLPVYCVQNDALPISQEIIDNTIELTYADALPAAPILRLTPKQHQVRTRWGQFIAAFDTTLNSDTPTPAPTYEQWNAVLEPDGVTVTITPDTGVEEWANCGAATFVTDTPGDPNTSGTSSAGIITLVFPNTISSGALLRQVYVAPIYREASNTLLQPQNAVL